MRLLRENRQIDRVLLVEFDLEAMLEEEGFTDFQLFWLILHRSRLVLPGEPQETAWLERWALHAQSEGTRAMDALRKGVEAALVSLGQELLDNRENAWLHQRLATSDLTTEDFYRQLLRLVYRLLFLMVAEERDLLFRRVSDERTDMESVPTNDLARERYMRHYSVTRLRREANRRRVREGHQVDLWLQLLVTFDAMAHEKEARLLGLGEPLQGGCSGLVRVPTSPTMPRRAPRAVPRPTAGPGSRTRRCWRRSRRSVR